MKPARLAAAMAMAMAMAMAFAPVPAVAETLVTSLSSHRVAIASNYTGTAIALFGAIERDAQSIARASPYGIVVTVRGPRQTLVVREKERVGPVWINRGRQVFPEAPAYLGVFASAPLSEITSPVLRQRQRIGLDAVVNAADFTRGRGGADDPFRGALLRLKTRENLYVQDERAVAFLTPSIFRASIPLPATSPPGNYDVDIRLLADTVVLSRTETSFEIFKIGFEQGVGEVARDWSVLYGLATAWLAILFGWISNAIFRRD